jgi:hypothetical protein
MENRRFTSDTMGLPGHQRSPRGAGPGATRPWQLTKLNLKKRCHPAIQDRRNADRGPGGAVVTRKFRRGGSALHLAKHLAKRSGVGGAPALAPRARLNELPNNPRGGSVFGLRRVAAFYNPRLFGAGPSAPL